MGTDGELRLRRRTARGRRTRSSSRRSAIARCAVTNAEFGAFVEATGHRTEAELFGWSFVFAGFLPDDFPDTRGVVERAVVAAGRGRRLGATRRARSPDLDERADHPVVHVSWNDARGVLRLGAARACRRRPSGSTPPAAGSSRRRFPWGDELEPGGEHRMNVFQGTFPAENTLADGFAGTAPVGAFAPNGFGLYNDDRQRLGVVRRLVRPTRAAPGRTSTRSGSRGVVAANSFLPTGYRYPVRGLPRAGSENSSATRSPTGSRTSRRRRRRARRTCCSSPGTTSATPRWTSSAARSSARTCARIADAGVKFANFHTTALCSPTRASLLTGRNATIERHGDDRRVRVGLPGHLDAHPVRERLHLRGARRARLQHLLRRQVAPHARARSATSPRTRAAGRSAAASSASTAGSAARRTTGIPDLVHDNHQIEPPGRPEDGYHLADDLADKAIEFIRDAKVDRPRQAVLHVPRPAGRPRAAPRAAGVGRQVQGQFDEGYEAIRAGILAAPDRARPAARGHRALADQPARRARTHRPRRPALAAARHRAALGLAERRRAAAVRPHGRGVRRLHLLLRRPARPGARLPRGVGPARQHDHRRRLRQRRQRRGRPERQLQRVAVLQRRPRHDRDARCAHRRARHARSRTTTTTPAGRGRSTRRSRTGSAGPATRAASPTCASCRGRRRIAASTRAPPAVRPRGRRRADDLRPARHRAARGASRATCRARSRARASPPRSPTPTRPARRRSSTRCSGSARSTTRAGSPARVHPPLSGWGNFEQDEWELFHLETDRVADARTSRPTSPSGSSS